MWFVILALLIVATYFVYDALRDKRFSESGHTMSDAQQLPGTANTSTAANYKNAGQVPAVDTKPQAFTSVNDAGTASVDPKHASGAAAGLAAGVTATSAIPSRTGKSTSGKLQFLETPIGTKDDLTRIDGIGPVIEEELNGLGIYHYHQIGNFSDSDVDSVNTELNFPGRIEREAWIAQARLLMTDNDALASSDASSDRQDSGSEHATMSTSTGGAETSGTSSSAATSSSAGSAAMGTAGIAAAGVALAGGAVASGVNTTVTPASNSTASSQSGKSSLDASGDGLDGDSLDDDDFTISDADLTGAWNTDVMIEVQERLKVLNTRESDAPRLNISREDYRALKDDDDERFSRDELLKILDRLRVLET